METQETMVLLEGPAHVLDVIYETIDAHLHRTGEEYEQVITGVGTVEAGNVGHEETSVVRLYVPASVTREDARERIELAIERIAADHDMEVAGQNVQVSFEDEMEEEA